MAKPSREEDILNLFFEEPAKHWRFMNIKQKVPMADNKISRWLKHFVELKIINKITPSGKMPYYKSNYQDPEYQNRKRIYALQKLHRSGFLNHLATLKAETVILFGSFSRWDWHKDSDIDIFIFGEDSDLEQAKYEKILHRPMQVFTCKNQGQLKRFNKDLLINILGGDLIKGDLSFVEVKAHA